MMKTALAAATAAMVLLASASVASASQPYERFRLSNAESEQLLSSGFDRCMDSSEGVTVTMRECFGAEQDRQDVRLNAAYRSALARLPNQAARNGLRASERHWLRTRWSGCNRELANSGGTLALLQYDACTLDEVQRRTAWLERYGR